MKKSAALLSLWTLALLAGCSHSNSADPTQGAGSESTDPRSPVGKNYVDVANASKITFHDDGTVELKDLVHQKSSSVSWKMTPDHEIQVNGMPFDHTPDGTWVAEGGAFRFAPDNDVSEAALAHRLQELKTLSADDNAPRPALSAYVPLALSDFAFLASSRIPSPTDEAIAQALIPGYAAEPDAFKKRDLMQRDLPGVKAKLAEFAQHDDYVLDLDERQFGAQFLGAYDLASHSFALSYGPCFDGLGAQIARIPVAYQRWGKAGDSSCRLTISDESIARTVDQRKPFIRAHIKMFFRFTGRTQQESDAGEVLLLDVSRLEFQLSDQTTGTTVQPIPGVYVVSQ